MTATNPSHQPPNQDSDDSHSEAILNSNQDISGNNTAPPEEQAQDEMDTSTTTELNHPTTTSNQDQPSSQNKSTAPENETVPSSPPPPQDFFKLKEISPSHKIILQNLNGPCPLLALANAISLRDHHTLQGIHADESFVELARILTTLADRMLTTVKVTDANMERMMQDAIAILPRMAKGLDVNVSFDGSFEFTSVLEVFDLFNVPILHGWCVDPDDPNWELLHKLSYNMATEMVFRMMDLTEKEEKSEEDKKAIEDGLKIQAFLQETQGQLTPYGLARLSSCLKEGEIGVFYWNGHFSTIVNHNEQIYLLATDEGYYNEKDIVFQRLDSARGESVYCRADFSPVSGPPAEKQSTEPKNQIDADYELAMRIQQEEEKRMQQHNRTRGQQNATGRATGAPAPLNTTSTSHAQENLRIPHREGRPKKPSPKASKHLNDPKLRYKNQGANLASLNEERRQRERERQHQHPRRAAPPAAHSHGGKSSHNNSSGCVIS